MTPGACSPEELDRMLEDAFLTRDEHGLRLLFEDGAVVVAAGSGEARGVEAVIELLAALWESGSYIAERCRVLQAAGDALVVGDRHVWLARRGPDGAWRFAISLVSIETTVRKEMSMSTQLSQQAPPAFVPREDSDARWWLGMLAEIKATAAETAGQVTVVEVTCPPGYEAPLHVHYREDESFVILDGSVRIEVGDAAFEAGAGDFAFGPRNVPHRYTVGASGCRMLFVCTPAGFEQLVREMSEPAAGRTLPPPSDEQPDLERMAAIAKANGCELLVGSGRSGGSPQ